MTIDKLVKEFVAAIADDQVELSVSVQAFERYDPRVIVDTECVTVWSIALNDDSTDVRYVMLDGGSGYIGEVVPRVKLVTEYVQV